MEKYVPSLGTRPPVLIVGGAAVLEPVLVLPRVSARVHNRTQCSATLIAGYFLKVNIVCKTMNYKEILNESYSKYYILYGMKM